MNAKPIFLLTTIVGLFFGIILMIFPEMIFDLLGITYLNGGPFAGRHTGAWVFAAAIMAFTIRNEEHSALRQSIFIFFALAFLLMVVAEIYSYFMATAGIMVWSLIALHSLFTLLYIYLYISNK